MLDYKVLSIQVGFLTVHARVNLSEGAVTGLETLTVGKSTVRTNSTYLVLDTALAAKHVNIQFVGRVGVRIFKYFYKRLDVTVDIHDISVHLVVGKNLTDTDAKPELRKLSVGDLKLGVVVDTRLGFLSWLANKIVNSFTNYLIGTVNLREKLESLLTPLLGQLLKTIDIPINGKYMQ